MGMTILAGLLVILVVVGAGGYLVSIHNRLVRLKTDIDKAWANIDVLLKQRHDELPKLIETCKGYMPHEQKAFQMIVEARKAYPKAGTVQEKAQADAMLAAALKNLFAVAKNYPELTANSSFLQLRGRIAGLEEEIAGRRESFNAEVNSYNTRIAQVPEVFVARFKNLPAKELFQVGAANRDVPVKSR
jgi:LemA protein